MSSESPGEQLFNLVEQKGRQLVLFQAFDALMQGQDPMLLVAPLMQVGIMQDSETLVDFARFCAVAQGLLPGEYTVSLPIPHENKDVVAAFRDLVKSLAYTVPNIEELYLQNNAITLKDVQFSTRFPRGVKDFYRKVVDGLQQQTDFDEAFLYRRHQSRRSELHPSIQYTKATEDTPSRLILGYSTMRRTSAPPPIPFEK